MAKVYCKRKGREGGRGDKRRRGQIETEEGSKKQWVKENTGINTR